VVGRMMPPQPVRTAAVGILGGTFDPIHYGHLAVAEEAREALGLEVVLFVPSGVPVHRGGGPVTAADRRVAMVELAIEDNPAFTMSRLEVDRAGPSYAVDTLEELSDAARSAGRPADFTFILSAEAFVELMSWREPERLLALCRMAVVPRAGLSIDAVAWLRSRLPSRADRVMTLDRPHLGHSATEIRARVAAGRSIRYLVPPPVAAYIRDHRLFQ